MHVCWYILSKVASCIAVTYLLSHLLDDVMNEQAGDGRHMPTLTPRAIFKPSAARGVYIHFWQQITETRNSNTQGHLRV